MTAESIFNKPLTKKQLAVLERMAQRQAADDDSQINYDDIPPLTDEQLATAIRGRDRKQLITARLDPDVLEWLKGLGGSEGYSTRINNILRAVMNQSR
ncbi:MAG: BrnA antitoxin family protein [Bryobacteraceae bacterium]